MSSSDASASSALAFSVSGLTPSFALPCTRMRVTLMLWYVTGVPSCFVVLLLVYFPSSVTTSPWSTWTLSCEGQSVADTVTAVGPKPAWRTLMLRTLFPPASPSRGGNCTMPLTTRYWFSDANHGLLGHEVDELDAAAVLAGPGEHGDAAGLSCQLDQVSAFTGGESAPAVDAVLALHEPHVGRKAVGHVVPAVPRCGRGEQCEQVDLALRLRRAHDVDRSELQE